MRLWQGLCGEEGVCVCVRVATSSYLTGLWGWL